MKEKSVTKIKEIFLCECKKKIARYINYPQSRKYVRVTVDRAPRSPRLDNSVKTKGRRRHRKRQKLKLGEDARAS